MPEPHIILRLHHDRAGYQARWHSLPMDAGAGCARRDGSLIQHIRERIIFIKYF